MSGSQWQRRSSLTNWRDQGVLGRIGKAWQHFGAVFYNSVGTHLPSHAVRLAILRIWGARIGKHCSILRGTTVLGIENLVMGTSSTVGFRCMIDARFGVHIGSKVTIASDVHLITAMHDIHSPDFDVLFAPVTVHDYAWIASRATVIGARVGRGAVVAACALVRSDVADLAVVGGVPARTIGTRPEDALQYEPFNRLPMF